MTSRTSLLGGAAAAAVLIQTKAIGHGTFNSPSDGQIKYVDKDHESEQYHSPKLTLAEARAARERGLIDKFDKDNDQVDPDDDSVLPIDENDIRVVGLKRTAEFAKVDDAAGQGSGTLDSRSSTAWEDRDRVEGGVQGHQSGATDIDRDSGDADAPPAPRKAPVKRA